MNFELAVLTTAAVILFALITFWLTKMLSCVPKINPDEKIDPIYEEKETDAPIP